MGGWETLGTRWMIKISNIVFHVLSISYMFFLLLGYFIASYTLLFFLEYNLMIPTLSYY